MGRKRAGASPLDPGFYSPLAVARSFWGSFSLIRSRGYSLRYAKTDLGRIFGIKYAEKAFLRKKVSKSGHVHGLRNSPTTAPLRPTTPKRASGNERAINQGGRGFSEASGRSAPGAPPARRGSPFLPRNGEKEGRGQAPWTPGFYSRSFPLARFGVVGRSGTVVELVRSPSTCPDLGTFFRKNACSAYFLLENASQIGLSIPEGIAPPPDQRQRSQNRARGSKRAIKPGVQGACPRPSFSPFLGRNGDPRRAGGAPGRCAPRVLRSHPPEGYALGPPAPPGIGEPSELPL